MRATHHGQRPAQRRSSHPNHSAILRPRGGPAPPSPARRLTPHPDPVDATGSAASARRAVPSSHAMTTGITVRELRPDDLTHLGGLRASGPVAAPGELDPDRAALLLRQHPGLSLVALDDELRIVGAVVCDHDGATGIVHQLLVADDCRQIDVAKSLMDKVLLKLQSHGIHRCRLSPRRNDEQLYSDLRWTDFPELSRPRPSAA